MILVDSLVSLIFISFGDMNIRNLGENKVESEPKRKI